MHFELQVQMDRRRSIPPNDPKPLYWRAVYANGRVVLHRASAATWVGVIIHSYSAKVSKTAAQIG